jgi:Arc/MetJ-type ribon-helix-helix transcriptional regulator
MRSFVRIKIRLYKRKNLYIKEGIISIMPEVPGRKEIRKEVRFDGYTEKLVDALMGTGDFANSSDLIRIAIQTLYTKYEAEQIPADLHSITKRVISRSVARAKDQKVLTVSRRRKQNPVEKAAEEPVQETEKEDMNLKDKTDENIVSGD